MFRTSRTRIAPLCTRKSWTFTRSLSVKQMLYDKQEEETKDIVSPSFIQNPYEWLQHNHGANAIRAPSADYNRWLQVAPPVATMLCLGGMYSWSLYNGPLTHDIGVITQVASDWSLSSVVPVFGTLVFFNGVAGFCLGKWIDRSGPRISYALGGLMYGGGLMLGSVGVAIHSLPLLYTGYGVIGGLGHGMCYISCISTLIQFFPDKRGFASGLALMGLGGGSILATPIIDKLLTHNFSAPSRLSDDLLSSSTTLLSLNEKGEHFIDLSQIESISGDGLTQIATLNTSDMLSAGFTSQIMERLADGATYLVGSGSTGAASTMLVVGTAYLGTILTASMFTKLPHPESYDRFMPKDTSAESKPEHAMSVEQAFRTPHFWFMWLALCGISSTGMGCISTAKTMMSEVFGGCLPLIVTSSFASTYVMAVSGANLCGRIGWGAVSDKIGQYKTFALFGFTGCALYASIPYYVANVVELPSVAPLCCFYGSTLLVFSYFAGGFSVMPSYEASLFGAKNVGAIHGRMMSAVALSGFVGPMIVTRCREATYNKSVHDLAQYVDGETFLSQFGASINDLDTLIQNKVVTINKLMQLIPEDVNIVDPTPFLYDSTMYAMSGCMALAALSNIMIKRLPLRK